MERVITISEATVLKSGTSRKGPWTLSAVKDTDGDSYTTFENDMRELAAGNIGAQAKILFTQDKSGNFTNNKLEDLEILVKAPQGPSNGAGELTGIQTTLPVQNGSDDRQVKIMRQTAAKVAATIEAAHPDPAGFDIEAFLSLADGLVAYFEEGSPWAF